MNHNCFGINLKPESDSIPKIALVLSGGGAKGIAHIGVLKVIDSLHIPVDFIVGTSMGSIIGGFYAMGYSGSEIEELSREQNWEQILTDQISRRHIPLSIRDEYDRYTLSFPIKAKKGIKLPRGLIHGQNIINLFCGLSYGRYGKDKIEDLPVKFVSVATDVVTGNEVIADSGNLAEAMRASMSIPYIFTPVDKGDMLLVDGGLRNNFPANIAKKLGADIVIGVDVQRGVRTKKELRGGDDMINQAVYFLGEDAYAESLKCVDIYIKPDVTGYGISDFYSIDSLITRGQRAARNKIPELAELREKVGHCKLRIGARAYEKERFLIRDVKFTGLEKIPVERLKWRLTFRYPGYVNVDEIRNSIDRIYGTLDFETVYYKLEGGQKDTLNFILKEKLANTFNVGLHFDTWENAALLLNTTFRSNVTRNGSRVSLNLKLSQYPRFLGSYTLDNGAKPGVKVNVDMSRIKLYDYDGSRRLKNITAGVVGGSISAFSVIKDSYTIGVGVDTRYYSCDIEDNLMNTNYKERNFLVNYFAYIRLDSREKANYAKNGIKVTLRFSKISDNGWNYKGDNSLYNGYLEIVKPLDLGRFTFIPQLYVSGLFGNEESSPLISRTSVGGPTVMNSFVNHVPFVGLRPFELLRNSAAVLRCDLQWEMWKRNFLIYRFNILNVDNFSNLRGIRYGMGLAYSYESVIGPMEAMVTWSDMNHQVGGFVNIGYWF